VNELTYLCGFTAVSRVANRPLCQRTEDSPLISFFVLVFFDVGKGQ